MRLPTGILFAAFLAGATPAFAQGVGLRPTVAPDAAVTPEPAVLPEDAVEPEVAPVRRAAEEVDPYAALGIRAGGFILYPSLTGTLGYNTNASGVAGASGSGYGILAPEFLLQSDWSRHAATLDLRGSYQKFFDGSADNPEGSVDATGRIDFADGWQGDLAAGYRYSQQAISDPDFPAGADSPPGVHGLTGSAGITGHAGRAKLTVEGSLDRSMYDDATSGGVPVDQGDRNNTLFSARMRAGYEATATLTPFVEGVVSRRAYDREFDNNGLRRSSTGYGWRVGVEVDREPLVTGEISVGMDHENFDDPTLSPISALTVDGSLIWLPTSLTTVTFAGSTELRPSTNTASSGSVVYDGSVDIAYAWRRNFTLNWNAGISHERFQGTNEIDTTYSAGLAATWKINRTMHLTAGYVHEWVESSAPGSSYQSDAVRMELRLQH